MVRLSLNLNKMQRIGTKRLPRYKDGLLRCYRCGEYKPPEEFHQDKARKWGRQKVCRSCRSSHDKGYQREYYLRHRETLVAYKRDYYRSHKDAIVAYQRDYYRRHREARLAHKRDYYRRHRRQG